MSTYAFKNNGPGFAMSRLHFMHRGVDGRPPKREIQLHLTGITERFIVISHLQVAWQLTSKGEHRLQHFPTACLA